MLNLKDFAKLYKNAKAFEEEAFDVRFEETVSLIEQEKYQEALPIIEKILKEGRLDIRLIMYRLFADFIKEGPASFVTLFPLIVTLLDNHFEKITPIKLRDKYTINSLTWFFSSITKKLKRSQELFKEDRSDVLWKLSEKKLTPEILEATLKETESLSTFLNSHWEQQPLAEHIFYITKWLSTFKTHNPSQEELPPTKEEEPLPSPSTQETSPTELLFSEPMTLLIRKLDAFSALIENEEFTKGALLCDDIRSTLENFNPTLFFPKLFSPYLSLVAKNIDTLVSESEQKGTPSWEALRQLYETDLDEFLRW